MDTLVGIFDIIARILGALIACGIIYLIPQINVWLKERIGEEKTEKLERVIGELVGAAEQMYKTEDPDGSIRKHYVEEQLKALGYELTEYINSLIESEVLHINWLNK